MRHRSLLLGQVKPGSRCASSLSAMRSAQGTKRGRFMRRITSSLLAIATMSLMASDVALAQTPSPNHVLNPQQRAQVRTLRPKFEHCRKLADQQRVALADRSGFVKSCLAK